jgi:type VI secretion system secreted protein Hcp
MTRFQSAKRILLAGAVATALCGATVAAAAVDMFLKMEGVPGESTDEKHKGEIDIVSFGWDVSPKSGDLVGRTAKVCAHDISFVKNVDKASPLLVSNAVIGTTFPRAILSVRKPGAGNQEFMTLELIQVQVSSVSHSVSGSGNSLETFTLNFASVTFTIKPQKADGTLDTPIVGNVARTC